MNIKSLLTLVTTCGIIYFVTPMVSFAADAPCQAIYGGGQTCDSNGNILVDKKVLNPKTNSMVDNLGIDDTRFEPGMIVTFTINVTNKSNSSIKKIDIKDTFPQYVAFSSGTGNFDTNTKTLTFTINELKSQETKTFTVLGKIASSDQMSVERGIVCVINQVVANADDNSENKDNVQFCIEKKTASKGGFPVVSPTEITATPSTGAESLALFSLLPTGIAGFALRKYATKKN